MTKNNANRKKNVHPKPGKKNKRKFVPRIKIWRNIAYEEQKFNRKV